MSFNGKPGVSREPSAVDKRQLKKAAVHATDG